MVELPMIDTDEPKAAETTRKRALGTALAELALTVSLIVSIVAVLVVTGASGALAQQARSDLIMMEESAAAGSLTTLGILTVIAVVMGVLTILALRDVAPAHSKRNNRRTTARR